MEESIVIVKYNAGNIQSVLYALERISRKAVVTDDHDVIRSADKVIFPGVGEASSAMAYLKERGLDIVLKDLNQPVLGICLGMQLMCRYSEENNTDCLGIFDEPVVRFVSGESGMKIPQIGWNRVVETRSALFNGIHEGSYFYFVHSYYAKRGPHTIGLADYIQPYSAALHKGNFFGVQFHPEKSAEAGEQLLRNFLSF
jgi:imidazole glycerol-phosphate synthase subunit HisH